ncbi:fibronectin type III domain-containing protein [Muricauda sp. 2012CJ35-5]|uniref:Fibronectin type III domain-containing protein n=1 Tax=Flagellimonas spongiicola TaxID=2942208 RepID=A0ABT0PVW8_9FLAO|nr:fibronectin type III domain-containing protein [Allomuricauda spongiicola]MCL6275431.1 fibronectin type III domain-containing protein [Allomuricauda spongiicola]
MKYLIMLVTLFGVMGSYGQNLIDSSSWTLGNGSVAGFPAYGSANESVRELDTDPFGNQSIIWKAIPDTPTSSGGWETNTFSIDHTKTYRFTVWMKKIGGASGSEIFAAEAFGSSGNDTAQRLNGLVSSNPIFEAGNVPNLGQWYLYVGFMHHSGYTGTTHQGGVYDPNTGNKVMDATDYKFSAASVTSRHRAHYWEGVNSNEILFLYDPTVYVVDGTEPTISELLNPVGSDTEAPTAPSLVSTGQGETTIDLSWSGAADNVGVTGYKVFKDAGLEATLGNVANYQVTGLTASTSYNFTVSALDAAGNESVTSNPVTISTNSGSGGGGSNSSSVWSENASVASYAGQVGVGTTTVPTAYKMAIDGKLLAEEVRVELSGSWPDYVFQDDYDLMTLDEIKAFIQLHGHLPNMPSAQKVEREGIAVGELNKRLLEKIEELTLHTIRLESEIKRQKILIHKILHETVRQPKK